jgi:hypothetical protein
MADNSKIPLDKRIIGRIRQFQSALTVVESESDRLVILERIAQLKRQLSSLKDDE